MASQTSSQTGATLQLKVTLTKSAAPAQQMPPAHHSDSHPPCHESHHGDDRHCEETKHSLRKDTTTHDSGQYERRDDAPPHQTQSEQMHRMHSTSFYKSMYQPGFSHSLPKLTDYISPLQRDAEIQRHLEALKNLPKPEFKVLLPFGPPMDLEQATSSSASLPTTTTLLPPTAPRSASTTTVVTTTSLPPMASTSVQSTTPDQTSMVISTCPVLGAAPAAGAVLHFEQQLPSEATTLPNYVCFQTMDSPHSITLATPRFQPCMDPSIE
uniref:Uncharacterized protein n=1 Tax=Romanomermis culicivorax TaxID=13658 RepID=A0A915K143_ROMCU